MYSVARGTGWLMPAWSVVKIWMDKCWLYINHITCSPLDNQFLVNHNFMITRTTSPYLLWAKHVSNNDITSHSHITSPQGQLNELVTLEVQRYQGPLKLLKGLNPRHFLLFRFRTILLFVICSDLLLLRLTSVKVTSTLQVGHAYFKHGKTGCYWKIMPRACEASEGINFQ